MDAGDLADTRFRAWLQHRVLEWLAFQVRALRKDRGWSQAELAERAGIGLLTVQHAENPKYLGTRIRTLAKIAAAFDVALIVRFVSWPELLRVVQELEDGTAAPELFSGVRAQGGAIGDATRRSPRSLAEAQVVEGLREH
jgi:transcriptional regulator with XRE-family HTH domain